MFYVWHTDMKSKIQKEAEGVSFIMVVGLVGVAFFLPMSIMVYAKDHSVLTSLALLGFAGLSATVVYMGLRDLWEKILTIEHKQ